MAYEMDKAKKAKALLQQEKQLRLNKQKIHQVLLNTRLVRSDSTSCNFLFSIFHIPQELLDFISDLNSPQRQKMKEEIEVLQENLVRSDEHLHFKELEFDKALQRIHWDGGSRLVLDICRQHFLN